MNDPHHLPPFTKALLDFAKEARDDFCTPGHHSGALFEEIPEGRAFVSSLGEGAFTADISDSSSVIGDPSSHEGVSGEAEALAASVYGSDRCFFVLGGTSASNRIASQRATSFFSTGITTSLPRRPHSPPQADFPSISPPSEMKAASSAD